MKESLIYERFSKGKDFINQKNMDLKLIFGLILLLFSSCATPSQQKEKEKAERVTDPNVKSQLQGVWLDKNTESPVLKIEGDSLVYASKSDLRMRYLLVNDTLFVSGLHTVPYPVFEQSEYTLSLKTPMGDEISLYKADRADLLLDEPKASDLKPVTQVIKKDSVIRTGKNRYHGYITINPTTIKVVRPGVTEDGFSIDNVYYDNIIHICVYEGRKQLCGKDIKRSMFAGIVPNEFLSVSILQDMYFWGKKNHKFLFRATLRVPDGPSYYAKLFIDEENKIEVSLIE